MCRNILHIGSVGTDRQGDGQMTQAQRNTGFNRWISRGQIVTIEPVVLVASDGRYACMVGAGKSDGSYNCLHLGFTPYKAVADRIALANVIGFASRG
jgi:hypothetical protein